MAAEVEVGDGGRLSIPRVDIAIDCGPMVNPERVRSQMEGAVIMGAGLATSAEISFKNGRVEQNNFDSYELTRIDTAPREIRVHLVPSADYSGRSAAWGAGRAAGGAGHRQRGVRGDGQAHPATADP